MASVSFDGNQPRTPVGHFDYLVPDDQWVWSDGLFELHGYAPGSVAPTTKLMLSHKHPDDAARTFQVLEAVIEDGVPFSCYHRIVDADQRVRSVLSVGHGLAGDDGQVERVTGYFVDLTQLRRAETQVEVDSALAVIARTRSVIDQAKGMLMLTTGCDADSAFELLREVSSRKNIKVNLLAEKLVEAGASADPEGKSLADRLTDLLEDITPYSAATP